MSNSVVPSIKPATYGEFLVEGCEIGADDIDWCTGFWNEMAAEVTPSLYPDSPIFSLKEFDWDDPVFLENVFVPPNVEETLAGAHLNGHPASLVENSFETKTKTEDASKSCEPDSILQVRPSSNATKEKCKRPRKPRAKPKNTSTSKRKRANNMKKTKPKTKK